MLIVCFCGPLVIQLSVCQVLFIPYVTYQDKQSKMETFSFPRFNRHQFQVISLEFLSMKAKDKLLTHEAEDRHLAVFSGEPIWVFIVSVFPMNSGESDFSFKLFLLILASKGFLLDWIDIIHFSQVSLM